ATGALPLSSLMAWLGDRPGQAALFLGVAAPGTTGPGPLAPGIGNLAVAQGVFVATAPPDMLRRAIASDFMAPGTSVALASRARPDLDTHGFVSPLLMLGLRPDAPAIAGGGDEASYWQAVTDMDSKAAYRAYLGRFPTGRFAADARARIDAIEAAKPETTPEEDAEVALALTRNDRREVQRWLELLGFDPRGIDGVFGPGTRAAITRWQARNGVAATGFLSAGNLTRMRNQAGARAAELRAEADRQKAAQDARDAAFWRQTGARGGEANLRAYLAEFPDGLFADAAKAGLRDIETANRNRERAEVRHAWDAARSADTAAAYRRFLERYPDSAFAGQAQAALDQASKAGDQRAERQAAKAEEESLGLSPELMRQVELRLARAGYETGTPDGDFDRATRRAIRQYQRARGLDVTGFLTRQTAVRLLSE
ncbi:MAG: peptidoglycan-binding domain-containing protein, partial [Pseudomonadota bacterium]